MTRRQRLGRLAEDTVAQAFTEMGFEILARNYACATGEVDLIAYQDALLVFIGPERRAFLKKKRAERGSSSSRFQRSTPSFITN